MDLDELINTLELEEKYQNQQKIHNTDDFSKNCKISKAKSSVHDPNDMQRKKETKKFTKYKLKKITRERSQSLDKKKAKKITRQRSQTETD